MVDYFISNSEAIVNPNVKALGISYQKIKVIHRGRDFKKLEENIPEEFRERFQNKTLFLTVGRLVRSKGQIDLIEAFSELSKINSNLVLLIAGDGPQYSELEKLIIDLGLEGKAFLLGFRNDIRRLLKFTDYFLFASYYEGLSGALIEAILMGKPCIVSDISENRECFPEGNGLYFKPGNISEIKAKIEMALKLDFKKQIKENYDFAVSHFSIDQTAAKYEKFYQSII
ncbi:glycosyltransferase family 4 protein [Gramella lutea]|uniref:Glycosyltransferase family 4 protein n=1 Tax=Christiangramia lutea TaxID=1607951 RepID=A0A9X2AB29_9FLAO|nr:glycosyltransferase family 4 protein [Christiangramia lutea]MCH4823811.1 glycosyltransferase family 4 protein [Christiangramia lutea]